jgi:aminotransferase
MAERSASALINLFEPMVGEDELAAIREVFSTNWLGTGARVRQFERAFGEYIGRPGSEVQAVSSCTEGLFQVVPALGLGPGDEVVLPSISFIAAGHAVRASGARVVPCDVAADTLNPRVEHVERALTPRTKAVLILHYGGAPGAVAEISELTRSKSLLLIEDAACALGSFTSGRACGTFGDAGVWSFDSMKVLSTGDGGMVWCRNEQTADRVRSCVRHGIGASGFERRAGSSRWWEIDPSRVGRRATMNDIAAAMGLVQLGRLAAFLRRRAEIAATYDAALADLLWLVLPGQHPPSTARIFYWIQTAPELRDRLATHLLDRGVYTTFRYWPLHRTGMYGCDGAFPGADDAAASTLLLPLHQGLSDSDVERVVAAVRAFAP